MGDKGINKLSQAVLLGLATVAGLLAVFPGLVAGIAIPISNEDQLLSDLLDVGLPLQAYAARSLAAGRLPLWFPGCYGGLPLAAIPEAIPYYPLTTLLYLFLEPTRACAWSLALHLLLAGVGTGLLAGRFGCRMPGQALAALAVSVGLWLPNHFRQTNLLFAAAWVPWIWLALERWLDRPNSRNAAALGLAGGAQALAGHPQILHHTAIVLGLWTIARLAFASGIAGMGWLRAHPTVERDNPAPNPTGDQDVKETAPQKQSGRGQQVLRRVAGLAGAAILAAALGAPHLFPVAEMAGLAKREQIPASVLADSFPPHPRFLATLAAPFAFGSPANATIPPSIVYWEEALYIGLPPLLMGIGFLALGWRRRDFRRVWLLLLILLASSLWLSYAQAWRFTAWTIGLLPEAHHFRFFQRCLWFTTLDLALAGGLGLTVCLDILGKRYGTISKQAPLLIAVAVPLITAVDLASSVRFLCPVRPPGGLIEEPASSLVLREFGANPAAFGERVMYHRSETSPADVAFVAAHAWSGPIEPYVELRRFLLPQHAGLWGWNTVWGYVGLVPDWVRKAVYDQHLPGLCILLESGEGSDQGKTGLSRWAEWSGLLGGRWVTSFVPISHDSFALVRLLKGQTLDCFLYENRKWAGPAWICHRAVTRPDDQRVMDYLLNESSDFRSEIVAAAPLPAADLLQSPPTGSKETVEVSARQPEEIRIRCHLDAPGFVVVSLDYHPRWRVKMDGQGWQRPLRVNLCQTAVFVPPGDHAIVLEFDGRLEKTTLAIAGLALIVGVALVLWRQRRRGLNDPGSSS